MTNRTIKFKGQGFGVVPVTVTVTANGEVAYNGEINTVNQPLPATRYSPDQFVNVFDLQVPINFVGTIPMAISVQSGFGMLLAGCQANYNLIPNPIYTLEQLAIVTGPINTAEGLAIFESLANPPLSPVDVAILANPDSDESQCDNIIARHGLSILVPGGADQFNGSFCNNDCRINVALNGEPILIPESRLPEFEGAWTRIIPVENTLTFLLKVEFPGVE